MLFYDIFIAPIELAIKFIFELSYRYTNDYLISTILLSLTVSMLILPLYYWAESLQKKEQKTYNRLKPTLDEFKRAYKGSELHAVVKTLYRQSNYHPVYSLRSLTGLAIQLPFFIAAYHFLSNYEAVKGVETVLFSDLGAPDAWLKIGDFKANLMPVIMTVINVFTGIIYLQNNGKKEVLQLWLMALLFLVLLYDSPSILLLYWTSNNILYLLKNIVDHRLKSRRIREVIPMLRSNESRKNQNGIIMLCLFIVTFLLFLLPTLQVINSSPREFSNRLVLVGVMFYLFLLSYLTLLFSWGKIKNPLSKKVFFSIVCFTAFYFMVNLFIFKGDYGLMDFFIFHRGDNLENERYQVFFNVLVFIVVIFTTIIFLRYIPSRPLFNGLKIVSLILVISGLTSLAGIAGYSEGRLTSDKIKVRAEGIDPKFYFSKNGDNVLVIFFDRFMGGFVPDILLDLPELKKDLAGFKWYPNTLSPGVSTPVGLPPIMGGYKYCDIEAMQRSNVDWNWAWKIPEDDQMQKRFFGSTKFIIEKFTSAGYRSFISDPTWLDLNRVEGISKESHAENLIGSHRELFFPDAELILEKNRQDPVSLVKNYLLPFSLFKVSPSSIKKVVYNNGKWWNPKNSGVDDDWVKLYLDSLSSAMAWPILSKVDRSLKGSFMFTTNFMTHDPYAALDNGEFHLNAPKNHNEELEWAGNNKAKKISGESLKRFKNELTAAHYFAAKEALKRAVAWIKWMKENDVYDNTKIVIVSDHGRSGVYNPMFKEQNNNSGVWYGAYHPILMTKEFNATGSMEIDKSFMTVADVPGFVLSAIETDAHKKYASDKSKGFRVYTKEGNLTIKDNIFDKNNWYYQK